MATSGIFQLITNDGKQDRMLMATALLNKRLLETERARSRNPAIKDPTPTLVDIERTHILFMNAHFKPFCAIGYEYNKVTAQSGGARLGATGLQFSIPQFGDFFSDMVLHITLAQVSAMNSAYWQTPSTNPAVGQELIRYVNFVGQQLVQQVQFTVNGNPLDTYTYDVENMHEKFYVCPEKRIGWNRCVGQEVPYQGFSNVSNVNGGLPRRGAGIRQSVQFFDGAQTFKPTQPALDIWIPLLFWFNMDPRLAIPSVSIPYGQRFITVDLAPASLILQHGHAYDSNFDQPAINPVPTPDVTTFELYINNIFVNPEIHDIFIKRIGFNLIRVHRIQSTRVNKSTDNILLQQMKWPIETLYVGLRPAQNIDPTQTLLLDNWNVYAEVTKNQVSLGGLQNGWAWNGSLPGASGITATQYFAAFSSYTGLALNFVAALTNLGYAGITGASVLTVPQLNDALLFSGFAPIPLGTPTAPNFPAPALPTPAQLTAAAALPQVNQQAYYYSQQDAIDTIDIQAHGIELYRNIPTPFFNYYIPFTYGGFNINCPQDKGVHMVTWNLYPGSYQPSGHINISRAREFYLQYTSSFIGTNNVVGDLVVIGVAINFLLISDKLKLSLKGN